MELPLLIHIRSSYIFNLFIFRYCNSQNCGLVITCHNNRSFGSCCVVAGSRLSCCSHTTVSQHRSYAGIAWERGICATTVTVSRHNLHCFHVVGWWRVSAVLVFGRHIFGGINSGLSRGGGGGKEITGYGDVVHVEGTLK